MPIGSTTCSSVKHLFVQDASGCATIIHAHLAVLPAEFKKEHPDAKVIAVDTAKAKKEVARAGLKFDGGTIASVG